MPIKSCSLLVIVSCFAGCTDAQILPAPSNAWFRAGPEAQIILKRRLHMNLEAKGAALHSDFLEHRLLRQGTSLTLRIPAGPETEILAIAAHQIWARHAELLGRYKIQSNVIHSQQLDQTVYCPTVFEIAHQGNRQPIDTAAFLGNCVEIKQCLGWVLAGAIPCINKRYRSDRDRAFRGIFVVMPKHQRVGITFECTDRILKRFTLGHRGVIDLVDRNYTAAQARHRSIEAR